MIWLGFMLIFIFLFYLYKGMNIPEEPKIKKIANSPKEFYYFMLPYAKEAEQKYGIKAEILIAHAALETGHGQRIIDYNLFNIKKGNWVGDTIKIKVKEYDEQGKIYEEYAEFRKYNSFRESIEDYIKLISTSPRYKKVWENRKNPEKYFIELQKANYATDPYYASKLLSVYKMYA
jgi:flagellar protein FlgJ